MRYKSHAVLWNELVAAVDYSWCRNCHVTRIHIEFPYLLW